MSDTQKKTDAPWIRLDILNHTYITGDGTIVAAELVDNACCLLDILHIANIRQQQRSERKDTTRAAYTGEASK